MERASDAGHESGELSDEADPKRPRLAESVERSAEQPSAQLDESRTRWDDASNEALEVPEEQASRWIEDDDEGKASGEELPNGKSRWHAEDANDDASENASERTGARTAVTASPQGESVAGAGLVENDATPVVARQPDRRDMMLECRSIKEFQFLKQIGSGTFGEVQKATDKASNNVVALKRIKLPPSWKAEGFPMTSIREINILLTMEHPNIVTVSEVVVSDKSDDVYMMMEHVQLDLKKFLAQYPARLKISEIKCIVQQMLRGVHYLHENWVLHRDLKPANILYDHLGIVKLCDFGLARHFGDPIPNMTPLVVTRYYRGPEIALGITDYGPPLDVWSVGVIAAELITNKSPFIDARSDVDLVNAITKVIGSPHDVWPGVKDTPKFHKLDIAKGQASRLAEKLGVRMSSDISAALKLDYNLSKMGFELIESMLRWDPAARLTTAEALSHPWFDEMPRVCNPCFMPQLPSGALRRS